MKAGETLVIGKLTHPGVFAVDFSEVAIEVVRVQFKQLLQVDIQPIRSTHRTHFVQMCLFANSL